MNWWRVELDESGAILKCDQVEAGKIGSASRVTYVRANTSAEAVENARAWLEKRRAQRRASQNKLREERRSAGLCKSCARPVADGQTLCVEHRLQVRASVQRRRHGDVPRPRPQRPPQQLMAEAQAQDRRRMHMRVNLQVVLREFDRRTPADFRNWLTREIAERDVKAYADMPQAAE